MDEVQEWWDGKSSSGFQIEEPFGIKQDVLVEGFTKILQGILITKRERWCKNSGGNFFTSHPNKNWSPEEVSKIKSGDIRQWDTTLLAKWLKEFRWEPFEAKLEPTKRDAIDNLRSLRNSTKHRANNSHLSRDEFISNCVTIQNSLHLLGIGQDTINQIIARAEVTAIVDMSKLQDRFSKLADKPWNFTTQGILGSGSFSIVISAVYELDQVIYAIKIIPYRKSYCDLAEFQNYVSRESRNLAKLDHKNVIRYNTSQMFEFTRDKLTNILQWDKNKDKICPAAQEFFSACFHDAESSRTWISGLYIQTEVCGETLRTWLDQNILQNQIPFDRTQDKKKEQICKDIVSGVNYIHKQGVIHRDLRPENIFFALNGCKFPIKIADFGVSNETKIDEPMTMTREVGNQLYRAPEMNQSHPSNSEKAKYSQAADLYSLGLIISEVYCPSRTSNLQEKFNLIKYHRNTGVIINENYPRINATILQLTDNDPSRRLIRDSSGTCLPIEFLESFKNVNIAGSLTSAQRLYQPGLPSNVDDDSDRLPRPSAPLLPLTKNQAYRAHLQNVSTSSLYNFSEPNNSRGQRDAVDILQIQGILKMRKLLERDYC